MHDVITYSPYNIHELKDNIANMDGRIYFIAGGTDWTINRYEHRKNTACVIYLGKVRELKRIRKINHALFIGAACTMTEIMTSNLLKHHSYAVISEAASRVGSWQIRNAATIGGNVANASPAADLVAPLLCLNACAVVLHCDQSVEKIPLNKLFFEPQQASFDINDVILGFLLPRQPINTVSHYYKLGFRRELSIARFGIATALTITDDMIHNANVVISSIGPKPIKMHEIENMLTGKKITQDVIQCAGDLLNKYIMNTTKRKYKAWAAYGVMDDVFKQFI